MEILVEGTTLAVAVKDGAGNSFLLTYPLVEGKYRAGKEDREVVFPWGRIIRRPAYWMFAADGVGHCDFSYPSEASILAKAAEVALGGPMPDAPVLCSCGDAMVPRAAGVYACPKCSVVAP